jgi:transcriptional regulator with XRE-family HTH domain
MTEKDVVRELMALRGWSQSKLASEAGFKSQSNITGLLNNNQNGIRIDNLFRMLDAMGCEIVVRDKMGSKKEWVIDQKEEGTK